MPLKKRAKLEGRGPVGKTAIVGMKDRTSNQVSAVIEDTTKKTLQGFVHERIQPETTVYTDDASPYMSLENHETVKHSHLEYVRGPVHANGIESFWSMLKRAHMGTFHKISTDHLHRYVAEFAGSQDADAKTRWISLHWSPDDREAPLQGLGQVHPVSSTHAPDPKKLDDMETIERLPWIRDVCGLEEP